MLKPKLVHTFRFWHHEWEAYNYSLESASLADQLQAQKRLVEKKDAEIERVRAELEAAWEEKAGRRDIEADLRKAMEEEVKKEKEKRIAHTQDMALRRVLKRELAKGFTAWSESYYERKHQFEKLKIAVQMLMRPQLSRGFHAMKRHAIKSHHD